MYQKRLFLSKIFPNEINRFGQIIDLSRWEDKILKFIWNIFKISMNFQFRIFKFFWKIIQLGFWALSQMTQNDLWAIGYGY